MSVLCFVVNSATDITQSIVQTANDCTLLGVNAFVATSSQQPQPTLMDLFAIPLTTDLQTMFLMGFGLPIICYLTAWSVGILISMFKSRYS